MWHFNLQILPQFLMFPNLVILGMIGLVIGYGIDCYSEKNSDLYQVQTKIKQIIFQMPEISDYLTL